MRQFRFLFFLIPAIVFFSCKPKTDYSPSIRKIISEIELGNLNSAKVLADSVIKVTSNDKSANYKADSLKQIAERIALDFSVTEDEVSDQLEKRFGKFSQIDKAVWENRGWLEFRVLNDNRMYFNRAVSNLALIKMFYEQKDKRADAIASDPRITDRRINSENIIKESESTNRPVLPVNMKITYRLTVKPDVVPDGETIRCWLPWPKEGPPRQQIVKLLNTSESIFIIAPDLSIHRTIFMEAKSKKGTPTIFSATYEYQSSGQYFDPETITSLPYKTTTTFYKKYTSEEPPQIHFSEQIRRLTDSIVGNETDPKEIIRKIYYWFKDNITWTGALEYSIMPDIPQYVIDNHRGDCGMQTFLFISMARYKGIPAKWQSGWMVPPAAENLHDWCEVFYEGTGWVPVDVSYDLQKSDNRKVREFYLSGLDSYRLIINDGVSGQLFPEKKYFRSEPYDFQRGEVEWKGGNLYFDKWNYEMSIEYGK